MKHVEVINQENTDQRKKLMMRIEEKNKFSMEVKLQSFEGDDDDELLQPVALAGS